MSNWAAAVRARGRITMRLDISHILIDGCLFLALSGFAPSAIGQRLGEQDFQVGALSLKLQVDSMVARMGHPDSTRTFLDEWEGFVAYYYPRLVIWVSKADSTIWTIDVYDSTLTTSRGVRIGNSVKLIDRVYPTKPIHTYSNRFTRVGPYDDRFENYSEYRLYDYMPAEDEGWVLVLFTKDGILTKVLMYVGVPE